MQTLSQIQKIFHSGDYRRAYIPRELYIVSTRKFAVGGSYTTYLLSPYKDYLKYLTTHVTKAKIFKTKRGAENRIVDFYADLANYKVRELSQFNDLETQIIKLKVAKMKYWTEPKELEFTTAEIIDVSKEYLDKLMLKKTVKLL